MDNESQSVAKFLQIIADIHVAFETLKTRLEKHPQLKEAIVWYFKPKFYEVQGNNSGFGLAIELKDGTLIDWWFELWWKDGWLLEHNVYLSAPRGMDSDVVIEFPDVKCVNLDDLIDHLSRALQDLLATVRDTPPFIEIP